MLTVPFLKRAIITLCAVLSGVLLFGLMLFYRSEWIDAQKLAQELTVELVALEVLYDSTQEKLLITEEELADTRGSKKVSEDITDEAIKQVNQIQDRPDSPSISLDLYSILHNRTEAVRRNAGARPN